MNFKPAQQRDAASYERQIQGLQQQLVRYRLMTHETFECMCGDWHCFDDPDVIECVDVGHHCRDANCGPCQDVAVLERRTEEAEDMRMFGP